MTWDQVLLGPSAIILENFRVNIIKLENYTDKGTRFEKHILLHNSTRLIMTPTDPITVIQKTC